MTFAGVPILDWVLLLVLLGFGVEACVTTRASGNPSGKKTARVPGSSEDERLGR